MAEEVTNPGAREDENLIVNLDEAPSEEITEEQGGEKPVAGKRPPVPGPAPAVPQAGLEDLKRQMHAVRQQAQAIYEQNRQLAYERDQAILFAQEAERRGVSTYELYGENHVKALQDKMIALSGAAEQAMSDGDFKRAQALNLEIGHLGGKLGVAERDLQVLQQQREQMAQQAQQRPQQRAPQQRPQEQVPTDPFERAIFDKSEP